MGGGGGAQKWSSALLAWSSLLLVFNGICLLYVTIVFSLWPNWTNNTTSLSIWSLYFPLFSFLNPQRELWEIQTKKITVEYPLYFSFDLIWWFHRSKPLFTFRSSKVSFLFPFWTYLIYIHLYFTIWNLASQEKNHLLYLVSSWF